MSNNIIFAIKQNFLTLSKVSGEKKAQYIIDVNIAMNNVTIAKVKKENLST